MPESLRSRPTASNAMKSGALSARRRGESARPIPLSLATSGSLSRWTRKPNWSRALKSGSRTRETTYRFLASLQKHLAEGRFQMTTDGFHFYERGVEDVFAGTCDFAQLIKLYGDYGQHDAAAKYSPGRIMEVISRIRDGRPDPEHISTSYVERVQLEFAYAPSEIYEIDECFFKEAGQPESCGLPVVCVLQLLPRPSNAESNPGDGGGPYGSRLEA